METIKMIYNIAESMAKVMALKVERLDIQHFAMKVGGIDSYVGYLYTDIGEFIIRPDGTFEKR